MGELCKDQTRGFLKIYAKLLSLRAPKSGMFSAHPVRSLHSLPMLKTENGRSVELTKETDIMATFIVWIDSCEAKVFKRDGANETLAHVRTHGAKHPAQAHGKHNDSHHPEAIALFKEMIPTFREASEVLLMGPGEAKVHFQKYLKEHDASAAKKIVGVETVDHPTDAQIHAIARKFFARADLGVKS
jgi:hypothetical protein